jgi:hypothetical protein
MGRLAVGQPAVGAGQRPHRPNFEARQQRGEHAHPGRGDQRAEQLGRVVVERVAGGQHEPAEPVGVAGGDDLGDRAAAVVADQDDRAQV